MISAEKAVLLDTRINMTMLVRKVVTEKFYKIIDLKHWQMISVIQYGPQFPIQAFCFSYDVNKL